MRTRSKALALAGLAVVGGLLLWWWLSRPEEQAAEGRERDAAALEPAERLRPTENEALQRPAAKDDASSRAAVEIDANATATMEAPRGIEVVPIVGAQRRRVEGATLWWLEGSGAHAAWEDPRLRRWIESGEIDERLREHAVELMPDGQGRFRLPEPGLDGAVFASAPGLWGWEPIQRAAPDPSHVELERDVELAARVVDEAGSPVADVRVALRQDCGDDCRVEHAVVLTDEDGIARFPHLRDLIAGDWDYEARYGFAIAEPLLDPVRVEFDPTQPPSELQILVLPPTGSVVLLLGEDTTAKLAQLELRRRDDGSDNLRFHERDFDGEREVRDGAVRFPFVGLGGDVVPRTSQGHRARAHDDARTRGPSRPGEEVQVRLALPRTSIRVTGRALDEAGAPLVDVPCRLLFASGDHEFERLGETGWSRTDIAGRFELALDRIARGPSQLELVSLTEGNVDLGEGAVTFDWPEGAETHDVGDVHVVSLPIVAEGRVVDERGRGLEAIDIEAWISTGSSASPDEPPRWTRAFSLGGRSGTDGHFVLRGEERPVRLALVARSERAISTPVPVRPGDRSVTLVANAAGELCGRLEFDGVLARDHLQVEAERDRSDDASVPPERSAWADIDLEGSFALRGLLPGSYTVRVHIEGLSAPAATIAGVRVEPGPAACDPRLDPLDLRRLGRWRSARVLEPDGTPSRGWVVGRPDPDEPGELELEWSDGPCLRFEVKEPELWLCTSKSVIERLDPANIGDTIQLAPAPRVRVVVSPDSPWPDRGHLHATVCGVGDSGRFEEYLDDAFADLKPDAPVEVLGRRLGPLQVQLGLYIDESADLAHEIVRGARLAPTAGVHVLEIRWTAEQLAKALAAASR